MSAAGSSPGPHGAWGRLAGYWRAAPVHAQGAALIVLATFFITGMDSCAKAMSARYDPLLVVWFRYAGQTAATVLLFAPSLARRLSTRRPRAQIARSLMLFLVTICVFYGFHFMPQADVVAVFQIAPLLTIAMAALLLGERVDEWRWAGVAIGFVGAMLVLRPGFSDWGWAAAFPLAAALLFAGFTIATRSLSSSEDPWTTFVYTGVVGLIAASAIAPWIWAAPGLDDLPALLAMGLLGAIGHGALIFAFSRAPASALAPYLYVSLIWAMLFGYAFFGDAPDVWTIAGSATIVGAGVFVQFSEARRKAEQRDRLAGG